MKVSIIVPVYNSEKYLPDCLYSLTHQTVDSIEIIAIDDASTDNSFAILKEFQNRYPDKIKVFHNEKNMGQSFSRNVGLQIATGEYIGFLDSDDFVHPQMYKTMVDGAILENYPEVIVTGLTFVKDSYYLQSDFKGMGRQQGNVFQVLEHPDFILENSPSVCNKLFRKDTLQNITFLNDRMWEDVAFSFTNLFNANRVLRFSNSDYFYRKSATTGVSAKGFDVNPQLLDIFAVADEIEKQTKKTGRYSLLKSQITFIQITTCLQRVNEIRQWKIDETLKEELILKMLKIITKKYGDFRTLDLDSLSSRIGFLELEEYKKMMIQINSFDEDVNIFHHIQTIIK